MLVAEPPDSSLQQSSQEPPIAYQHYRSGNWIVWQTTNFRIGTINADLDLDQLPELCETLRTRIGRVWNSGNAEQWIPRCEVVVHSSLKDYQQTLGTGVGSSVGCATVKSDGGRIVSRRIDIRIDAENWHHDALPHELTHIVLADLFGAHRPPPWIDEGIGVLSESDQKRKLRVAAFELAREKQTVYSTSELVLLRNFPKPEYRDAFYVQSAALVRRLLDREGPEQFKQFAKLVIDSSTHDAVKSIYGLDGLSALTEFAHESDPSLTVSEGGTLEAISPVVAQHNK